MVIFIGYPELDRHSKAQNGKNKNALSKLINIFHINFGCKSKFCEKQYL